jgi:hypothetical protein
MAICNLAQDASSTLRKMQLLRYKSGGKKTSPMFRDANPNVSSYESHFNFFFLCKSAAQVNAYRYRSVL